MLGRWLYREAAGAGAGLLRRCHRPSPGPWVPAPPCAGARAAAAAPQERLRPLRNTGGAARGRGVMASGCRGTREGRQPGCPVRRAGGGGGGGRGGRSSPWQPGGGRSRGGRREPPCGECGRGSPGGTGGLLTGFGSHACPAPPGHPTGELWTSRAGPGLPPPLPSSPAGLRPPAAGGVPGDTGQAPTPPPVFPPLSLSRRSRADPGGAAGQDGGTRGGRGGGGGRG